MRQYNAPSPNSGHMVRAYALTQMLGFASHFVCPRPLYSGWRTAQKGMAEVLIMFSMEPVLKRTSLMLSNRSYRRNIAYMSELGEIID